MVTLLNSYQFVRLLALHDPSLESISTCTPLEYVFYHGIALQLATLGRPLTTPPLDSIPMAPNVPFDAQLPALAASC